MGTNRERKTISKPKKKPPRAGWVGPLFSWELLRLARRGHDIRARFILALTLLVVLTIYTIAWFPQADPIDLFTGTSQLLSLAESASFGQSFTLTFILAQLAVLCLLTPAYAAGGIAEEKERKTLDFLLVSELSAREILLGKFLGRLVFLLGVMFAGLPILALAQLYGGVSIRFLLAAYFITATTITVQAAVSAAAAVAAQTYRGALFRAYGIVALHVFAGCGLYPLLSPFALIVGLYTTAETPTGEMWFWIFVSYGFLELIVAVIVVSIGAWWMRKLRAKPSQAQIDRAEEMQWQREQKERKRKEREQEELLNIAEETDSSSPPAAPAKPIVPVLQVVAADPLPQRRRPPPRRRRRRPVPDEVSSRPRVSSSDPFLWKETYTKGVKRDNDDDSIKGIMLAVGITLGVVVGGLVAISLLAVLVDNASQGAMGFAQRALIFCGVGGLFTYMLVIGTAAVGMVIRERQQQTLESLLTIPVPRQNILLPKWKVSIRKGIWWGIPVSLALPLGYALSDVPIACISVFLYVLACVPFTASYGIWLSTRCITITRGVLWLLPIIGTLMLIPLLTWSWTDQRTMALALSAITTVAGILGIMGWVFWKLSIKRFENEGRT